MWVLATKPNDPSSIPGSPVLEGENSLPQIAQTSTCTPWLAYACKHTNTYNFFNYLKEMVMAVVALQLCFNQHQIVTAETPSLMDWTTTRFLTFLPGDRHQS